MATRTIYSDKEAKKNEVEEPIVLRQSVYIFVFKIFMVELVTDFLYTVARSPELYFNLPSQLEIELIPNPLDPYSIMKSGNDDNPLCNLLSIIFT